MFADSDLVTKMAIMDLGFASMEYVLCRVNGCGLVALISPVPTNRCGYFVAVAIRVESGKDEVAILGSECGEQVKGMDG